MVGGYVGLVQEVFTDGHFGYPAAPGWQNRFPFLLIRFPRLQNLLQLCLLHDVEHSDSSQRCAHVQHR